MPFGTEQLREFAPSFSLSGTVGTITWFLIIVIFAIFVGIVFFIFTHRRKFKYKIVIFERVDGRFQPTRRDRAMETKVGKMGHVCLWLKKHRVYRPRPKLQTGMRTYWYFIREDGQWINFEPGDWDAESRSLGAHMLDTDMRMADAELEGALKARYDKPKVWAQYGTVIISMGFIVIVAIMAWFLFDKWIEIANTINNSIGSVSEVLEKLEAVLARTDNVCSKSGIVT